MFRLNYSAIIILLFITLGFAQQGEINGRVVDDAGLPLESANVYLKGTILGAATDNQGNFNIENVPFGNFVLTISMIGYQLMEIPLNVGDATINMGTISLQSIALKSQPIVVTAGRYEQILQDVSSSIGNITANEIGYRNAISIDDALQYVSGLNLTGSQINIRGSSGYSRGVGSRVLMLVDGIPYLTADTKETNFESLQINQIERIEIVKGAGSALYGSNAIGGVINIINKKIEKKSLLNIRLYGGLYSDAYYPQWKWSDRTRYLSGIKFDYSNKSGKIGYRIGASHDQNDSYKQNAWRKRYHLSGMLEFDISPFQELKLSGTYMNQNHGSFLYWKNLSNALVPPDDQVGDEVESQRWHLSGQYRHILDHDRFITIKGIWFRNHFDDNIASEISTEGNESISDFFDTEIQYNFSLEKHQFTTGIEGNISTVSSNIFSGEEAVFHDKSGQNGAIFVQDEINWNDDWSVTPGLRIDYFNLEDVGTDTEINPKIGTVFKPWIGAAIRSSAGRGFRAPSIAEVFTSSTASGLTVIPNLSLKPERSISIELGYNQFLGKKIFFDVALFSNRFWDLIEASFTGEGKIKFQNVTNARSVGFEINFNLTAFQDRFFYNLGYTFVEARDVETDDFLIFRPRHLFYNHVNYKWNDFRIGIDYRFIDAWDRIEENLILFVEDAEERVPAHIIDLRLSYSFLIHENQIEASFQINNLLQYHYLDLVGSIAPTRNFILTLTGEF